MPFDPRYPPWHPVNQMNAWEAPERPSHSQHHGAEGAIVRYPHQNPGHPRQHQWYQAGYPEEGYPQGWYSAPGYQRGVGPWGYPGMPVAGFPMGPGAPTDGREGSGRPQGYPYGQGHRKEAQESEYDADYKTGHYKAWVPASEGYHPQEGWYPEFHQGSPHAIERPSAPGAYQDHFTGGGPHPGGALEHLHVRDVMRGMGAGCGLPRHAQMPSRAHPSQPRLDPHRPTRSGSWQ